MVIDALYEFMESFLVVYPNDLIVYTSLRQNTDHLRLVFQNLRECKLYTDKDKYGLAYKQINFLAHKLKETFN